MTQHPGATRMRMFLLVRSMIMVMGAFVIVTTVVMSLAGL